MANWRNSKHPVFISYSWSNHNNPNIEDDVKRLCELMEEKGIFYLIDKGKGEHQLLGYPNSIPEAEKVIGRGDMIIIVFSKKYLLSPNCWYEWHRICRDEKSFKDRVFPIILPDVDPWNLNVIDHWREMKTKCIDFETNDEKGYPLSEAEKKFVENVNNREYRRDLETLVSYFKDTIIPHYNDLVVNDYQTVIDAILKKAEQYFDEKNELPELKYKPQEVSVERPDDTKALFNRLQQNQFVNLVGMGGMGKTCLANLLVKDYSKEYGNVVYSLINGSFYSDITDKDSQLKLIADRYKMSVGDKVLDSIANTGNEITGALFRTLVNVLDDNYTARQNLWIIDVNETADYAQVSEALKYMFSDKHLNENWRVLIVSRVAFIEKKELRNSITRVEDLKNSNDFLKQVFFHYLVDYTKDEDDPERYLKKNIYEDKVKNREIDLDKIIDVLFGNPLLIEQLASYLRDIDPKDQQQILNLFVAKDENGNRLSQEEVCESVKRDKKLEYEFLAQYLSSLVFFNKLDDLRQNKRNEHKEIARHLMLWPADFYKVDDIFTLMRGATFNDKDDLQKYLNYMSEQRIVEKQTDDKGVSSYKMHGLIADALRVQVLRDHKDMQVKEVSDNFRNYSQYLANIEKLKKTSSEIDNCLSFCFAQTKMTSETYLPAEFFDEDEKLFNADFFNKLAGLTRDTPLYEKWYKLKLIEEVCGIEDHTQKLKKYQEYKDKSSHKVYEDYLEEHSDEFSNNINSLDFGDKELNQLATMVEVKAGEFVMGDDSSDAKKHNVTISSSFYIWKYPVTQKLLEWVVGEDCLLDFGEGFVGDRKPLVYLNWYFCMYFIVKLNKKTGLKFRLPTEAEWEYAAYSGELKEYFKYSGSDVVAEVAWNGSDLSAIQNVDDSSKKPNGKGIYGMSGNVWEWCSDWYDSDYYKNSPIEDPQGPSMGSSRVCRGGSCFSNADCCRVAYRANYPPCNNSDCIGFRLALSNPPNK